MRIPAALLGALLLASPRAAHATSCAERPVTTDRDRADTFFAGVVESVGPSLRHPMTQIVTRVRVVRAWKGEVRDRVDVEWIVADRWMGVSEFSSALRGNMPLRGDTLLFGTILVDGRLTTGVCGVTGVGSFAQVVAALGPGTVPLATAAVAPVAPLAPRRTWPAAVALLLLAGAAIWRMRRRAR